MIMKMDTFEHVYFVSGKLFVSFYYLVILSTKNLRLLPPFHEIFVQKIPNQNSLDQNVFSFVNRFSKCLLHTLQQNKMVICTKKIFHLDKNSFKISTKTHYQTLGNTL